MVITEDDIDRRVPDVDGTIVTCSIGGLVGGCQMSSVEPVHAPEVVPIEKGDPEGGRRMDRVVSRRAEVSHGHLGDPSAPLFPSTSDGPSVVVRLVKHEPEFTGEPFLLGSFHRSPRAHD